MTITEVIGRGNDVTIICRGDIAIAGAVQEIDQVFGGIPLVLQITVVQFNEEYGMMLLQ